jgi:hypothetical protein
MQSHLITITKTILAVISIEFCQALFDKGDIGEGLG